MTQIIETVEENRLTVQDLEPLADELEAYQKIYDDNQGDDANAIRAMQHFMSQGAWQDSAILNHHWQEVEQEIGSEEGVLIADGSGIPKQGQDSVGVKRQLKELNFNRPQSDLNDHREQLKAEFEAHPAKSITEAVQRIEKLTGIRRSPT